MKQSYVSIPVYRGKRGREQFVMDLLGRTNAAAPKRGRQVVLVRTFATRPDGQQVVRDVLFAVEGSTVHLMKPVRQGIFLAGATTPQVLFAAKEPEGEGGEEENEDAREPARSRPSALLSARSTARSTSTVQRSLKRARRCGVITMRRPSASTGLSRMCACGWPWGRPRPPCMWMTNTPWARRITPANVFSTASRRARSCCSGDSRARRCAVSSSIVSLPR